MDGELLRGDVEIAAGRIAAVGVSRAGGTGIAIPGLVDLQVKVGAATSVPARIARRADLGSWSSG